jgi:hypothetical protein
MLFAFVRGFRSRGSGAPPPPPPGMGLAPDAPAQLATSGSLVGQATIVFTKPSFLGNGDPIAGDPVTHTRVYRFSSEAESLLGSAGSYTDVVDAGTGTSANFPTVAAGTWWFSAECENGGGISNPSPPISAVVT